MSRWLIKKGSGNRKEVAFTFDDGPDIIYTEMILDVLKEAKLKASFFVTGREVSACIALLKRMISEGHEICNHTFSHRSLLLRSNRFLESEITRTDDILQEYGLGKTNYFRPPYGRFSLFHFKVLKKLKKKMILWNIGPKDFKCRSSREIEEKIIKKLKPGSIIVLHDGGGKRDLTVNALPTIIRKVEGMGYKFVTISELLF